MYSKLVMRNQRGLGRDGLANPGKGRPGSEHSSPIRVAPIRTFSLSLHKDNRRTHWVSPEELELGEDSDGSNRDVDAALGRGGTARGRRRPAERGELLEVLLQPGVSLLRGLEISGLQIPAELAEVLAGG